MNARYRFVPWVRAGAAATVADVDPIDGVLSGRAASTIRLRVNDRPGVAMRALLRGPGDVISLDTQTVVRSEPPHLTSEFEPNYFPAVEFDRPDVPWMFTPATGDDRGRLRPWLCLVVVRRQVGVALDIEPASRRPVLRIEPPARWEDELPDLGDSWAWAHAQVVTTDVGAPLEAQLAAESDQNLSRLICPRRLEPDTGYLACVVPAFDVGRKSGLGLPIDADDERELRPAWQAGPDAPPALALPVYYHWEFSTGEAGDFELLVRRLQPRPLPEGVGTGTLSVKDIGFNLADLELAFAGALRAPGQEPGGVIPQGFQSRMSIVLNAHQALPGDDGGGPIVGPPVYGHFQAAETRVRRLTTRQRPWLDELNLDPRHRAAAGLGVLVVQDQQEQLMASAWAQLGRAGQERRLLRHGEFAGAVLNRVHTRLARLDADELLATTTPLHARVVVPAISTVIGAPPREITLREQLRESRTPPAVLSVPFRRAVRPRGPLVRRRAAAAAPHLRFTAHIATAPVPIFRREPRPDTVTAAHIAEQQARLTVPSLPDRLAASGRLRQAVDDLQRYVTALSGRKRPSGAAQALRPDAVRAGLLERVSPTRTLVAPVDGPASRAAAGEPALPAGPSFPQPMYEVLRELAPGLLLVGGERVPADTVVALETNPSFIEAFLVGLNHEISRELLWREYPSDQRGTPFRTFWAPTGRDARGRQQIPPIHEWDQRSELGSHLFGGASGNVVVLVRGELLSRYPGTTIYATRSNRPGDADAERVHPIFRGQLGTDMTFLGFAMSAAQMSTQGWFVVFEQQPTEPRFGLDASTATGRPPESLSSWADLAWGDVAEDPAALAATVHVPLDGRLGGRRIDHLEWGANSGHMAAITLQRAVRVAIPFSRLTTP